MNLNPVIAGIGPRVVCVTANPIRPIAIGIFRSEGRVLVGHAFESKKNEYYCRPPGGGSSSVSGQRMH